MGVEEITNFECRVLRGHLPSLWQIMAGNIAGKPWKFSKTSRPQQSDPKCSDKNGKKAVSLRVERKEFVGGR